MPRIYCIVTIGRDNTGKLSANIPIGAITNFHIKGRTIPIKAEEAIGFIPFNTWKSKKNYYKVINPVNINGKNK